MNKFHVDFVCSNEPRKDMQSINPQMSLEETVSFRWREYVLWGCWMVGCFIPSQPFTPFTLNISLKSTKKYLQSSVNLTADGHPKFEGLKIL